ncbi:hypothetical protein F8388_001227 [Cannabis sativa]|uniref:RNase H type-1 domain-containing protein n=1 Tax=Cannabis sativa TaxID=3483 RepID=A0A7J6GGV5_CANSA|nr:hypothetical protein F8388_001227 [Cannabis sativa]
MLSPEKSLPEGLLEKPANAMDELLSQTNKLTVLDEDGWEINEEGDAEVGKLCAIGRLCSNRTMNRSLIKTILGRVWGLPDKDWGVEIKYHSRNSIFLVFSFKSSQDLNRILLKNPWFLSNGTLILDRMNGLPSNWENCLSRIQLSGRILSLPPKSITQKNLERLAGMAGELIEVQKADGYGTWLKVDEKKDTLDIFGKGKLGPYSHPHYGNSPCKNNVISPTASVQLGTASGNVKNSDMLSHGKKAEASNMQFSCVEDMELILNHDTSLLGKSLGWEDGKTNGDMNCMEREGAVNLKRNGDGREELKEKTPAPYSLKSPVPLDPRVVNSIQKTSNPAPFQLFEVPIEYDNIVNNSGIGDSKTKRRKITPRRLKNGGNSKTDTKNSDARMLKKTELQEVLGSILNKHGQRMKSAKRSFKSGYKLRFRDPNIAECSDNSTSRAWWKVVWGSRLTPKMKIFIWRVFHHWIPVKTELTKRGMSMNLTCNRCKSQVEDVCHALWNIPKLHKVWKHFGFLHHFPSSLKQAPDFLMLMKGKLSEEFFIGITWLIWYQRNKCVFQNKDIEDDIWIPWATEMMEIHLASAQTNSHQNISKDTVKWSPPPPGTFMINTDASLIEGQPGCGLGVIIRDHLGALVTATTEFIPGCLSVLLAEAMAIRLALKLAETRLMQNIFIASDSQSVINALKGKTHINTDWGFVIDDCIQASKKLLNLSFIFSLRKCNSVAHCIANWSRLYHATGVWTSAIPDCAAAFLEADMPLGVSL